LTSNLSSLSVSPFTCQSQDHKTTSCSCRQTGRESFSQRGWARFRWPAKGTCEGSGLCAAQRSPARPTLAFCRTYSRQGNLSFASQTRGSKLPEHEAWVCELLDAAAVWPLHWAGGFDFFNFKSPSVPGNETRQHSAPHGRIVYVTGAITVQIMYRRGAGEVPSCLRNSSPDTRPFIACNRLTILHHS
jgi:hypothetical protein